MFVCLFARLSVYWIEGECFVYVGCFVSLYGVLGVCVSSSCVMCDNCVFFVIVSFGFVLLCGNVGLR